MSVRQMAAVTGLVAVLLAIQGDEPAMAARIAGGAGMRLPSAGTPGAAARKREDAGVFAQQREDAGMLGSFMRFGWVSPPVESTTAARVAEYAGAGLDLMLPAWQDSGRVADNLSRLDYAAANGLRCLIWDRRFEQFFALDPHSAWGGAVLDTIVADYKNLPAFGGYYLGDEPPQSEFPLLAALHAELRARDPSHPAWNNLLGSTGVGSFTAWQAYVRAYLDTTHAAVLCYDEYDFLESGDRGLFVGNLVGAAGIANEYGIPFWAIVQLIQHYQYRALTEGEMRWQVAHALAYGAHGVGYFTYWTPAPDTTFNWHYGMVGWDGQRTPWYAFLARLNPRVAVAGRTLAGLAWHATVHSGSVPIQATAFTPDEWIANVEGRAALGEFTDALNGRFVLVANSDSAAAQAIALTFPGATKVERLSDDGSAWAEIDTTHVGSGTGTGTRAALALEAGDFTLLRVGGEAGPPRAGSGPGLAIRPNPAHHAVEFVIGHVKTSGRVEILDSLGRRIWSRTVASGSGIVTWD
ncbi:MAG: hypothetical protein HYR73_04765 [Candidatus Eisenbacteria bacterium]|nr:hypothetical protein [Candidatus Eisenbacteria bacterium]